MGALFVNLGGGGGVGSDELTATKDKVLSGETYVGKDTNDEIGTGSMPNNGAVTPSALGAGETYTIPAGFHNGSGKVIVKSLAELTEAADATNSQILEGNKAYVDGVLVTGIIPRKGAATYYATTSDQTISAYQYLNGAQTIKKLTSSNLSAGNIRNGVKITVNNGSTDVFSVTGSLAVTSAINFKATAQSATVIRISWTNPSKGPWEGVEIRMSTSGNPGVSGGTQKYKGKGNNATAGGSNYVDISGLSVGTTYYFTCTSYATGLGNGSSYNVNAKTKGFLLYDNGKFASGFSYTPSNHIYSNYVQRDDWKGSFTGSINLANYTKICFQCQRAESSSWRTIDHDVYTNEGHLAGTGRYEDGGKAGVTMNINLSFSSTKTVTEILIKAEEYATMNWDDNDWYEVTMNYYKVWLE